MIRIPGDGSAAAEAREQVEAQQNAHAGQMAHASHVAKALHNAALHAHKNKALPGHAPVFHRGQRISHAMHKAGAGSTAQKLLRQLGQRAAPRAQSRAQARSAQAAAHGGETPAASGEHDDYVQRDPPEQEHPHNPQRDNEQQQQQQEQQSKQQDPREPHARDASDAPAVKAAKGAPALAVPDQFQTLFAGLHGEPRRLEQALQVAFARALLDTCNLPPDAWPSSNARLLGHKLDLALALQRYEIAFPCDDSLLTTVKKTLVDSTAGQPPAPRLAGDDQVSREKNLLAPLVLLAITRPSLPRDRAHAVTVLTTLRRGALSGLATRGLTDGIASEKPRKVRMPDMPGAA
jgi:hypothetical protein